MSDTDFARQLADRFTRWQNHCLRARATPILCLGATSEPGPGIVVLGCEEDDDRTQIHELLTAALKLTAGGRLPLGPASSSYEVRTAWVQSEALKNLPLGPASSSYEVLECDLKEELHDHLAAAGRAVPMSVIRSWPSEKFFEELHAARKERTP